MTCSFYRDIHVLYLYDRQILHKDLLGSVRALKNIHQPEIEGCGLAEVERAHRQTSHGYRHGVVT